MSLSKDHLEKNEYPCHSKVKKDGKKICTKKLRSLLKRKLKKEEE